MTHTSTETVLAWLAAVNAGDVERALERTAPDIAIVGPRGTGRGRDVLRRWLEHAGATFETRAVYSGGTAVVVAQRGVWRDQATDEERGVAEVATRFGVVGEQVAEIQRYDDLTAALRDAGLTTADACQELPDKARA